MTARHQLMHAKRWVVKIGSALLTANGKGLDTAEIANWTTQIAELHQRDIELVLVSSGAVAAGMSRLGWSERPHAVHDLQAAAAVGQMGLIQAYESCFQKFGLHTAQVLLGHDDISARDRYLNARGTLTTLLKLGVIPVVNENDTVVTDEIQLGDNDTLAALVANLVDADILVILTDQQGLYESDPRCNPHAELVDEVGVDDARLTTMAGESVGALGRGGMITKVNAAKLAARSGTSTVIAGGNFKKVLIEVAAGNNIGTLLRAEQQPLVARKQWLAGMSKPKGSLQLDAGAVKVLRESGRSLLPVGISAASGIFNRGDLVSCYDDMGREVARGLVNYNVTETKKILGKSSDKIELLLGYQGEKALIHRDNLVLI